MEESPLVANNYLMYTILKFKASNQYYRLITNVLALNEDSFPSISVLSDFLGCHSTYSALFVNKNFVSFTVLKVRIVLQW